MTVLLGKEKIFTGEEGRKVPVFLRCDATNSSPLYLFAG